MKKIAAECPDPISFYHSQSNMTIY